jgi:hypothetical protein
VYQLSQLAINNMQVVLASVIWQENKKNYKAQKRWNKAIIIHKILSTQNAHCLFSPPLYFLKFFNGTYSCSLLKSCGWGGVKQDGLFPRFYIDFAQLDLAAWVVGVESSCRLYSVMFLQGLKASLVWYLLVLSGAILLPGNIFPEGSL